MASRGWNWGWEGGSPRASRASGTATCVKNAHPYYESASNMRTLRGWGGGKEQEGRRREEMKGEGGGKWGRQGMKYDKSKKWRGEEGGWGRGDPIFGSLDVCDP